MFGRNLRQLARLTTATIPFKSVKPIKDAGQLCLIVVPFKGITLPVVHSSTLKKEHENSNNAETMAEADNYKTASSIYDFTVKDNSGNDVKLDQYKGHVVLIVNIASQCGLTKNNYKKITELKEKYYDQGLRVLSFPCNQFGSQMPEANGEEMVCHLRDAKADVGDVFQKIDVNGSGASPLYKYLKHKQGGTLGDAIKWNFTKFLVDKNGQPVKRYAPTTDPMDLAKDIEKYL